jgi:chemotaxis protein methyltransferase CheR
LQVKPISDAEFAQFQRFIFEAAGISMADAKKALVTGRLGKRLAYYQLETFGEYFRLLTSGQQPAEVQIAVDLLTTNETYFFRESKHFDFLRAQAIKARNASQPYRVWSAASSSGEEAYSIAMVLADCMQTTPWDIVGTDISTRVLEGARRALYSLERGRHISARVSQALLPQRSRTIRWHAAGESGAAPKGGFSATPTSTRPA